MSIKPKTPSLWIEDYEYYLFSIESGGKIPFIPLPLRAQFVSTLLSLYLPGTAYIRPNNATNYGKIRVLSRYLKR
jgi:hypothetical protein